MKFAIKQSELKAFLEKPSTLVDEGRLRFDADEMSMCVVDPANVGMNRSTLRKEAFESYDPSVSDDGDGVVLGVNLERLSDVVGMGSSGDIVRAELDEETRKLHIEVDGLEYTLALIDPDSIRQEPDIPELDLPAHFSVESNNLGRGIKAADMVSDHIRLRFDDESRMCVIEAEGDTDDVDLTIGEDSGLEIEASGPGDSLFSLDYLKDLKKAFPKNGDPVKLQLGEEFPVKISFEFSNGDGECLFMLAPRIQS